jgi:autotransporter-associated beta strand protein
MKPKAPLRHFLAIAGSSLLAISQSHADQTWDGTDADDDLWSSADNWGLNTIPTWASAINFGGNTRNSTNNDLAADELIGGINFTNDGSVNRTNAFTLSGSRITLGGNITTTANTAGSTIMDVIDMDMILSGDRTITTNQQSATVQHNLTISGDISSSGAFGIIKAGSGILSLGGNNSYSGQTTVNVGTLRLENTGALASSSGLTMANGTTLQLRKDTAGGTFTTPAWALTSGATVGIDVNNITTGTGQTLALSGALSVTNLASTLNITGGNSYALSIPTVIKVETSVA